MLTICYLSYSRKTIKFTYNYFIHRLYFKPRKAMDYLSSVTSTRSKIFIGGIKRSHTEQQIRDHFEKFGLITNVQMIRDPETKNWKGFGYITYADFHVAQRVANIKFHDVKECMLEVKYAGNQEQMQLIARYDMWKNRGYEAWPKPCFSTNFMVNMRRENLVNDVVHSMFLTRLQQLDKFQAPKLSHGNNNRLRMNPAQIRGNGLGLWSSNGCQVVNAKLITYSNTNRLRMNSAQIQGNGLGLWSSNVLKMQPRGALQMQPTHGKHIFY